LTPTGEVEAVNAQVLTYCGRTMEELKQWGTSDIVHPDDLPGAIKVISDSMKSGDPYEIVERIRRFDGVYRWFQVRGLPLRGSTDRIIRWYVLLTDIDDRKKVEEALQSSERNLSLMINAIPTFMQVSRPETAEFFSRHYLDYVGLSAEQASGWGWTAAVTRGSGRWPRRGDALWLRTWRKRPKRACVGTMVNIVGSSFVRIHW
jgi:PAS domain S-box-containing protein